jgi:hypothetical protein
MLKLEYLCWPLLLAAVGCEAGDLISNPMTDRWCGDRPCSWEVEGQIARVSTWHSHDFAVALLSDQAKLSQLNASVSAKKTECYSFSLIADVAAQARVFLELDFLDDGVVEFSQRLPPSRWELRTFLIKTPSWYEGVRFIVRKDGPGEAALAELSAKASDACSGERVKLEHRPDGVSCEQDTDCEHARCAHGACSFCHDDCASGEICGLAPYHGELVDRCTAPHTASFGEGCSADAQCREGACCDGVCSECCPGTHECADAGACARSKLMDMVNVPQLTLTYPFQCSPGEFRSPTGATCSTDLDCRSGHCTGGGVGCDRLDCDDDAGVRSPNCEVWCPRATVRAGSCN